MEMITRDEIDYLIANHSLLDIVNFNEYAVLAAMRDIYGEDGSLCRCSLCVEDIYALSLNSLPPRYIQSTSVHTYEKSVHFISQDDVADRVREAATKVKERPNH